MDVSELRMLVFETICKVLESEEVIKDDNMPLIGGDSLLDSMQLVELCVSLEDKATELGFEFDWTSDTAMSRSRSMFRTAGTLADEFIRQKEAQQ